MKMLFFFLTIIILGTKNFSIAATTQQNKKNILPTKLFSEKNLNQNHFSKIIGTVQSINSNQIVIQTKNGKTKNFELDKNIEVRNGSHPLDFSQIKSGTKISIRFDTQTHVAKQIYPLTEIPALSLGH